MKNIIRAFFILLAATSIVSSCKKDDSTAPSSNNVSIAGIITTGSWRISYYTESGNNNTSLFSGYVFNFYADGTMTATHSSGTINGTWRIDDDGSNEFHMSLGNSAPLEELDRGWQVVAQSSTEIQLQDDDITHDRQLHLTKI